jgi:uncharacterized phage infection (PIP) family protein YhgE
MDDKLNNQGRFKMKMDADVEEAPVVSQVDELRMEKLGQRVTMISILIPVLIVVVLVIAYMDIKQRVIRTEDTGVSGVQKLSQDVESRFSTLSLRQAKLEELLKQTSEKDDQSLAQIQVNLKKLEDRVKGVGRNLASKKDLDTKVDAIQKKIDNVSNAMDENQANVTQINSQMQTKLSQMGETLENRDNRIAQLETQLAGLDQEKIDKSALDLAISLEALKIKQSLKSQLDDIDARLKALETRIKTQSRSVPAPRSIPSKPIPSVKPQQPSSPSPAEGSVKEQPIQ